MKKINIHIALSLVMLLLAWACAEEDNLAPEGNWELSTPSIQSPADGAAVTLDETTPGENVTFTWNRATSTAGYGVFYSVVMDTLGSTDFNSPIIEIKAANGGKGTTASISYQELDEVLSKAGYPANEKSTVKWAVKATCLSKSSVDAGDLDITRFATEITPNQLFISGEATEKGSDLSQAIQMKRLNGPDKTPSNKHEIYTKLEAGKTYNFYSEQGLPAHQYGGADGNLVKNGDALSVEEEGVYRINIDLDNNTYALFKVDQFGAIGSPFETGWGGDQVLEYQGGSVWKANIDFVGDGGFIFRANGTWENILKRVKGTDNEIVAESDAATQGLEYEDVPSNYKGLNILTLDLSAAGYTYTIEKDPDAPDVSEPIPAPEKLFLFADGVKLHELTKAGDTFNSDIYLALQNGVEYTFNAAEDASGQGYSITTNLGVDGGENPKAFNTVVLTEDAAPFFADVDQAYMLELNFAEAGLKWSYFRLFLFHWDQTNDKWDDRNEFEMTYEHPYILSVTADLKAGFDMKFNSPWDVEFGAGDSDDATALSGTMTNKAIHGSADNFTCIKTDGTYKASIVIDSDFGKGTYEFAAQ